MYSPDHFFFKPGRLLLSLIVILFFLSVAAGSRAGAETLIPIYIESGTNLITIARQYCHKQSDWKTIAEANKLKSPYIIIADRTIQVPLSILHVEDFSAEVAALSGTPVLMLETGEKRQLNKGDRVLPGQTIVTKEEEFVHLVSPDHRYTRIEPQSELQLHYLLRLRDNNLKAEFFLKKGKIINRIERRLKANESFRTRTPLAITGVRGTEYRLKVVDDDVNLVETLAGEVSLTAQKQSLLLAKGRGSKVEKGQPPAPPKALPAPPSPPALKSVYRLNPVRIMMPDHEVAKRIRVRIARDVQGNETIAEQTAPPGQEAVLPVLADGPYQLFLTAIDAEGFESIPGEPVTLHIRTNPPAPIISSPGNAMRTFDTEVDIRWLHAQSANHYSVQLALDEKFTDIFDEQDMQEAVYRTPQLEPGRYFFRTRLVTDDGFTTLYSVPLTWEVLEKPQLGSFKDVSQDDNGIELQWPAMADAAAYALQVAHDGEFKQLIVSEENLTKPNYALTYRLSPGNYHVRMRAIMKDGQKSPWTEDQVMTIAADPVGLPYVLITVGLIGLILL